MRSASSLTESERSFFRRVREAAGPSCAGALEAKLVEMDRTKSGFVSRADFTLALKKIGVTGVIPASEWAMLKRRFDKRANGGVAYHDLVSELSATYPLAKTEEDATKILAAVEAVDAAESGASSEVGPWGKEAKATESGGTQQAPTATTSKKEARQAGSTLSDQGPKADESAKVDDKQGDPASSSSSVKESSPQGAKRPFPRAVRRAVEALAASSSELLSGEGSMSLGDFRLGLAKAKVSLGEHDVGAIAAWFEDDSKGGELGVWIDSKRLREAVRDIKGGTTEQRATTASAGTRPALDVTEPSSSSSELQSVVEALGVIDGSFYDQINELRSAYTLLLHEHAATSDALFRSTGGQRGDPLVDASDALSLDGADVDELVGPRPALDLLPGAGEAGIENVQGVSSTRGIAKDPRVTSLGVQLTPKVEAGMAALKKLASTGRLRHTIPSRPQTASGFSSRRSSVSQTHQRPPLDALRRSWDSLARSGGTVIAGNGALWRWSMDSAEALHAAARQPILPSGELSTAPACSVPAPASAAAVTTTTSTAPSRTTATTMTTTAAAASSTTATTTTTAMSSAIITATSPSTATTTTSSSAPSSVVVPTSDHATTGGGEAGKHSDVSGSGIDEKPPTVSHMTPQAVGGT
jgi:hypothetical protein